MAPVHVRFTLASRADAVTVHRITQAAYAEYRGLLKPPSGVERERAADVERALEEGGAVVAWVGDTAVATGRFRAEAEYLHVERLAVLPAHRGQGIARALLAYFEEFARRSNLREVRLEARLSLPRNVALYQAVGYQICSLHAYPEGTDTWAQLAKPVAGGHGDEGTSHVDLRHR
jgi:ribosomal protein S18 acetylase RimI-like enzyme